MDLLYKDDWEQVKRQFIEWWARENTERCLIAVTSPKAGIRDEPPPVLPSKVEDRWLNLDYLCSLNEYRMNRTFYGGEAFPIWSPGHPGWDGIHTFAGGEVRLMEDTGWLIPMIGDGLLTDYDYNTIQIDEKNHWLTFCERMYQFAVECAKGKSIPGFPAFGGCGDTLAALRGTNRLIFDVIDCPSYVREFEMHTVKLWAGVHRRFFDIVKEGAEGNTCWLPLWAPGRYYAVQNDFSYMISPKMFQDIFMPAIDMYTDYLDYSVYHLDGVNAFAHIDALLDLNKLNAIQVLPGEGKPSAIHYMDLLKKVQAAGKNLVIVLPPKDVRTALECLSSKGLYIETYCRTEDDARELLKEAEKWSIFK